MDGNLLHSHLSGSVSMNDGALPSREQGSKCLQFLLWVSA